MQVVAVNIGNSSIKYIVGRRDDQQPAIRPIWKNCVSVEPNELKDLRRLDSPSNWFVSSVNARHAQSLRKLAEKNDLVARWHNISYQEIPLRIAVAQPEGVGIDRLLAAVAAKQLYAGRSDVIVIDCGTALTIDVVRRDDVFCGGLILAGPAANLLALSKLTDALPDLSRSKIQRPGKILGDSTQAAMLSGAYYGGLGAIKEIVAEITRSFDTPIKIVGTGGGFGPWRDALPDSWVLVDNLVLDGIFVIASNALVAQS